MKRNSLPPWRKPGRLVWLFLALCAAGWLTVHMPEPAHSRSGAAPTAVSEKDSTAGSFRERGQGPSLRHKAREKTSPADKLAARGLFFGRLFLMVAVAAFVGGLMEVRRWNLVLARFLGYLTRKARLPLSVGLALPAALYSNAAANSMLVSSHEEGRINDLALIAGGMANSYLTYVSHSLRVLYPVVATVGLVGVLYFAAQFTGGLLVIAGVLIWNRRYVGAHPELAPRDPAVLCPEEPLPWSGSLKIAALRAAGMLFRMVCLTVPLMLGIEWLLKSGAFAFWEDLVPQQVTRFFPAQLVSVVAAQMGGLVQSSLVAAHLRSEGLIDSAQILLAMLVASAVGNPVRMLRRNLPSALGIFPSRVAFTVVLGMQFSRLVVTLALIALLVAYMHYVLY